MMKLFLLILCSIFLFASCTDDSQCDGVGSRDVLELKLVTKQFLPLRSGEFYSLWSRGKYQSAWKRVSDSTLFSYNLRDSNIFYFYFSTDCGIVNITDLLLTIEQEKYPSTPGRTILQSVVTHQPDTAYAYFTTPLLPDADKISGAVTFTSRSSDSAAYTREFYLLKLSGNLAEQSLQNLPPLPADFQYGVWAYHGDFFPPQQFLYGTFTSASGNDDDAAGDEYPFPGGAKKAPLNTEGGYIFVTLEPILWGSELKTKGPSAYRLLEFERRKNLVRDSAYQMNNIAYSLPTCYARIVTWKKIL